MNNYGITAAGFNRKPFLEIEKEISEEARRLFGDDVDLTVQSPVGLFTKMLSWDTSLIWQELEKAYYSNWLETAVGVNLDRVVALGGLAREEAQKAFILDVEFHGDSGIVIPENFEIETPQGVKFLTVKEDTITEEGCVKITCRAVEAGLIGMVGGNINWNIPNHLSGLNSVENPSPAMGGSEIETDAELRERFKYLGAGGSGSSADAIRKQILQVEGVSSVSIYENNTIVTDGEGRPPKCIECIVLSDEAHDQEIAKAIFHSKSAGVESFGSIEKAIEHEENTYTVRFNRPDEANIFVEIVIRCSGNYSELPFDLIKENTANYIRSILIGEDIYAWRILTANSEIDGIENISVKIKKENDEDWSATGILSLSDRQIAVCDTAVNISISELPEA